MPTKQSATGRGRFSHMAKGDTPIEAWYVPGMCCSDDYRGTPIAFGLGDIPILGFDSPGGYVDKVMIEVMSVVATATCRISCYLPRGQHDKSPNRLLWVTAPIDCGTAGIKVHTFAAPVWTPPGPVGIGQTRQTAGPPTWRTQDRANIKSIGTNADRSQVVNVYSTPSAEAPAELPQTFPSSVLVVGFGPIPAIGVHFAN